MSLTVIRPRNSKFLFTTSTRSSRCVCISAIASSRVAPSRTVTSRARGVIMFLTGCPRLVSKRRSRLVTMPTTRPFASITGNPEILCRLVSASTSRTFMFRVIVIGSLTTPLSKRLTLATSAACARAVMFLCIMPMPPSCAIAIASRDSVTVSIAADTRGRLRLIVRVRRVFRLTSRGRIVEWAGISRTSSKVRAFWTTRIGCSPANGHYTQTGVNRQATPDVKRVGTLTSRRKIASVSMRERRTTCRPRRPQR